MDASSVVVSLEFFLVALVVLVILAVVCHLKGDKE